MLKKIAKFFIKLIIVLLTLALIGLAAVAGWYFYSGYNLYKTTLENEDLISRVDKVEWSEDYIPLQYVSDYFQDAIVAVEYLNRFYVVEGHKRVSVLRYFGATTVQAEVKRLLPPRSDETEIAVYYEFLDFYKTTHINYIRFSRLGAYPSMLKLLCGDEPTAWDEDRRRGFYADVVRFRKAYAGSALSGSLTQDEALMRYMEIFGAESLSSRSPAELKADLAVIAPELKSVENESEPVLVTDPAEAQPRSIISRIVHPSVKKLNAAFLHDKEPENSYWTYAHEQGRLSAQEALGERVETQSVFNMLEQDFDTVI